MTADSSDAQVDPRLERLVEICTEFPPETYEKMDNNRLAVYGIRLLEEHGLPITHEALTVSLFLLFPAKFSLVAFPQYPDAERVNRTLLQLGEKYRNWASGNRRIGYTLNETGQVILEQTRQLLENPDKQRGKKRTPRQRTRDPDEEIKEIEASTLYQAYVSSQTEEIDDYAIWELLQAFPYTPKRALRDRIKRLREAAKAGGRDDIGEFLAWARKEYEEVFSED